MSPSSSLRGEVRVLVAVFAFNEGDKIRRTLARHAADRTYDLLVVDDGSTDGSVQPAPGLIIMRNERQVGIGASMRRAFAFALEQQYDILAIQAGNDKDDPTELPLLLQPILEGRADFVQGSRFLNGGVHANMPRHRVVATQVVHPALMSLAVGKRVTESTNGFRAFRTSILRDERVDWRQPWLDRYELEPYLLFKAIALGYRHCEVAVSKRYPPREEGYTKMRPLIDWWSIIRPIVYLGLRLKK